MKISIPCRKLLASLLLFVAVAVLIQGVFHEILHKSESDCHCRHEEIRAAADHSEDCHSHHQSCSSLSCANGAVFLASSMFCWQTFCQIELFTTSEASFQLPIVAASFFKPPRTSAA